MSYRHLKRTCPASFVGLLPIVNLLLWLATENPEARSAATITLTETAGLARAQYPVEVAVPISNDAVKDAREVRLFRVEGDKRTPVACQVVKVEEAEVPLVFMADVP